MRTARGIAALGLVLTSMVGPGAHPAAGSALAAPRMARDAAPSLPRRASRALALVIRHVSPAPGAVEVPAGGLLAVEFGRPMVPLAAIGVPGRHLPITITPAVAGQGRWLGTSLWALSGPGGLAGATIYTVRLAAGLRALDGSRLGAPVAWSFSTVRPAIEATSPADGSQHVGPRASVAITFNQPVDRASALAATTVAVSGGPAPGGVWTWQGRTMTFHPRRAWPAGAAVTVRVGTGLRAASGGVLAMLRPAVIHFSVAPPLGVLSTSPPGGELNASLANGVTVSLAAPINPQTAQGAIHVRPAVDAQWVTVAGDGLSISIGGGFLPATRYTITVDRSLAGLFGGHLPAPYTFSFVTQAARPSVSFYNLGPVASFDLYRSPVLYARAINVTRLTYALYRPSEGQFRHMASTSYDWSTASAGGMTVLRRWSVTVRGTPNRAVNVGQRLLDARGKPLPSGYYYVTVSGGSGASDHQLFLITGTGLTLKVSQRQILVWATDLKSGLPVPDLATRVVDDAGRVIAAGRTDRQGLLIREGPRARGYGSLLDASLLALSHRPGDIGAVSLGWNSGITPWDYNLPFTTRQPANRIYLYTERPIYRPGQHIFFRGVARADDDGRYSLLPVGTFVRVTLIDALGHTVFSRYSRLGPAGTFDGTVALGPAAALGGYTLNALVGADTGSSSFSVEEYRKPSFALSVAPDRGEGASYVQGERITVRARASYYFGAALGHAPVAWSVLADDYLFQPPAFPDYSFADFDAWSVPYQASMGNLVTQATGATDATGTAAYALRAGLMGHRLSQRLTIEAQVGDPAHESVAERTQVIVHAGSYYLGLRAADVVGRVGRSAGVDLIALRPDGTGRVGGARVTLRVYRREWYSVYMRDPATGNFQWQTRPHDTLVSRQDVSTDAAGTASLHWVPRAGGEYRVTADAVDARGNAIHSATYVWVGSDQYTSWGFANNDRLRLVADRTVYHSGDTARVLVPAPLSGMLALVTIERGRVISHRLERLRGNSTLLAVPITTRYVPDVYVGVVLVKGSGKDTRLPVWKMGYLHLAVDEMERALRVTVTPDKVRAAPGERVTYAVHTSDYRGRPVAAEVSLALVDAAVLALAQDSNASILDTFYADRELGVETAQTLSVFVDRLNLEERLGAKGGSGGGGGGGGHPPTRHRFPDTAYWNPRVTTDGTGNASVAVSLPDSLTTWRMVARGVTPDGLVGGGSADIVATKSLLISPALPRFLTLGDSARIGGVVANNGPAPLRVRATVTAAGAIAAGAPGGFGARTVTVPAGGQTVVTWPVAARRLGSAAIEVGVTALDGSGRADRAAATLPVLENSTPETVAAAGSLTVGRGATWETVSLPAAREPGEGELTISLQPSVAAGLGEAASMLAASPYDSVEQTASRAVGTALLEQLPAAAREAATARSGDLLSTSVQRLLTSQHGDGGWGWWTEDQSSPYMSAYVVDALLTLRHLGATVDPDALNRGLDYLHQQLTTPAAGSAAPNTDLLAYIASVLARGGRGDLGATVGLLDPARIAANGMPTAAGQAYLALALARITGDPRSGRVLTLLSQLESSARVDATGTHWDADSTDWRTLASSVGATAVVLDALVTLDPRNPLIPRAARWLLAARAGAGWATSQQTALAIRALVHVAQTSGELTANYGYTVVVAGQARATGVVTRASLWRNRTLTVPLAALPPGGGTVRFVLRGAGAAPASGRLYYTLRLRYFRPVQRLAPLAEGVAVTRSYAPVRGIAALGGGTGFWSAGSTVRVTLSIVAPQDLYYVTLEDPIPAGTEGVNSSLQTTSATAEGAGGPPIPRGTDDLTWYIVHSEVRDDRVALFADYLPAGAYRYTYLLHVTTPGLFHALPTRVSETYFPDVFGRASGGFVRVHGE